MYASLSYQQPITAYDARPYLSMQYYLVHYIGINLGLKIEFMFQRKMFMFDFSLILKFLRPQMFLYSYQISNVKYMIWIINEIHKFGI